MTIKKLYEWAIENKVEGFEIEVQYRDGEGCYPGTDDEVILYIDTDNGVIIL